MIKWCLYMQHLSSKAYETITESGVLKLPSQRCLRDYTHHMKAAVGFSSEVDRQLVQAADASGIEEWQRVVALVMDEMYIKQQLVHSGALIGFTDLGSANNCLLELERSVGSSSSGQTPQLAKTMLVYMFVFSSHTSNFHAMHFVDTRSFHCSGRQCHAWRGAGLRL